MISIPSSSNTTSALQRMRMMIVQMLQHAPYWFRVLGWRGKNMLCSIACSEAFVETRPGGPFMSMSMSVTLRVDNEGKHASWSGGSSAWDRLPKQVSGLDFNENACNSPVSFVSVHLAAEVNQAAEDEKEAAECWALSSWSRVCSLHGQRFLNTSRHTLHEFTKLILKRYPIISHHIPSDLKIRCFILFHDVSIFSQSSFYTI